ncbi:hypothetical protein GIB67_036998 [Kingdonia uniflora]|uniref:Uncharacterized protein n=1 Tax=Kingdonia uniflora TaxID=39325 RepID=A0A7J7LHR9_9MAGN|nr:hypothetical protein GIB67_036998 [Kingdonia uniflora]
MSFVPGSPRTPSPSKASLSRGKKGVNHIEDAHQLRLLYNRHVQWRYANAQAESVLSIQNLAAKNTIYSDWNTTFELRDSVIIKRINLQQLRQELKATEALEACTLRLPVTSRARADMDTLKKAICSAVDVMQTMASSICLLLSRAEGTNCLVFELGNVTAQERALLDKCGDLLASTTAVQVEEKSLRTHLMQLKQTLREEALFNGNACVILPSDASLTTTYKMSSYS